MEAAEAIRTRRSVSKVTEQRVPKDVIESILQEATRAPTHHLTQPWRFIVLSGPALGSLGEAMADRVRLQHPDAFDLEQKIEFERSRPFRAPVIVTVIYVPSTHPRAIEAEDRYSVGALLQNILLGAHARGLGAYPRTGPSAEYEGVHRHLGLADGEEVAAFIYLGYPVEFPPESRRKDASELTTWSGWED